MPVSSTRRRRIRLSATDAVVLHFAHAPYGEVSETEIVLAGAEGLPGPLQIVMTVAAGKGDAPLAQTEPATPIGDDTYRLRFDPAGFADLTEGVNYFANVWLRDAGGTAILLAHGRIDVLSTVAPRWGGAGTEPDPRPVITIDDTTITMDDTSITIDQGA